MTPILPQKKSGIKPRPIQNTDVDTPLLKPTRSANTVDFNQGAALNSLVNSGTNESTIDPESAR
jgi:hypothetical protein